MFFSNYPINPPIIKLLNTNVIGSENLFKLRKLIKSDNNINLEIVNPSNWKITNNLSEVITILHSCLKESV